MGNIPELGENFLALLGERRFKTFWAGDLRLLPADGFEIGATLGEKEDVWSPNFARPDVGMRFEFLKRWCEGCENLNAVDGRGGETISKSTPRTRMIYPTG